MLNAGVMMTQFIKSSSGHELHFTGQLSVDGSFIATVARYSKSDCENRRTAILSDGSHIGAAHVDIVQQRSAPKIFEKLDDENSFSPDLYNVSKLLGVLWICELASKTRSSEAFAGASCTEIRKVSASQCSNAYAWTTAQGGHCLTDVATVKQAESHGGYLNEQNETVSALSLIRA